MNAISVNKNIKVNQVSSRTHSVRADSNLVGFFIGDDMKLIPLTQGKFAMIDDKDYKLLSQFKWYASKSHYGGYVAQHSYIENKRHRTILMHRMITDALPNMTVDHKNHNRLDNQKHNLRVCTNAQNNYNRGPKRNSTSKYKGVYLLKQSNNWCSQITKKGKIEYLGTFKTQEDAAKAYDKVALELFGNYAYINIHQEEKP